MILEIGKSYIDRRGSVVRVTGSKVSLGYPFMGDNGITYTKGGKVFSWDEPTPRDLIQEQIQVENLVTKDGKLNYDDDSIMVDDTIIEGLLVDLNNDKQALESQLNKLAEDHITLNKDLTRTTGGIQALEELIKRSKG